MSKKIMILGGNAAQVPLITTARELGYTVVLIDNTTTNPGVALSDIHYQVNFKDKQRVLEIATLEKIEGVISNSEAAMPNVAYIAEKLNLVGNTEQSIISLGTKHSFRNLQEQANLYYPRHVMTATFEEALAKAGELTFPVIMKPCSSSGSRGTTIVTDASELLHAKKDWYMCSLYSLNKKVVLEEYVPLTDLDHVIDGDVFIHKGQYFWDGLFTSKRSVKAPLIPMTQSYPILLPEQQINEVKDGVRKLFEAAGIVHGEYNIEGYYTRQSELFFIEINARQGGNGIPFMIEAHSGVNMYKLLLTTAMGDDSYFDAVMSQPRALKYIARQPVYSHIDGTYRGLFIDPAVQPFVTDVSEKKQVGESIPAVTMAGDAAAFVSLEFPDMETEVQFVSKIEDYIYPMVDDEPLVCDRSFSIGRLKSFLERNDNAFTHPLSESLAIQGTTVEEYARKLCEKGTIVYEPDGSDIKGILIGYTHDLPTDGGSYITQVVTDARYRGQGVFKRIMERYIRFCKDRGISTIWLTTNENNLTARKAYERVGFVPSTVDARGLVKYTYHIDSTRCD